MAVYLIAYVCIAVFVGAVLYRGYRALSMPIHLRWEIYPVAHEKGRAHYGGSYFEELDWWTKPRPKSRIGEIVGMGEEILLLKGVWENNRPLWYRSWPFHLGLYVLVGFLALLVLGAILQAAGVEVSAEAGGFGAFIAGATVVVGWVGFLLAGLGALALLVWRLTEEDVRDYTKVSHIFNLAFFVVVIGLALAAVSSEARAFADLRAFVVGLITFNLKRGPSGLLAATIVLGCLLIAYIPLTHMAHFFLKYCTWHQIRWNDEPNLRGSHIEKKIQQQLVKPVSWSAPHIGADGKRTWADIATSPVSEENKEEEEKT